MNKDPHILYKSNDYALRLMAIFNRRFHKEIFEFIHTLLSESQIKKLNSYLLEEMTQFVKISKTIKKTQSNKKIKNIDINKSFLKSFRDRLNSSILDEDDWVGAIEALYLNKKETYYKLLKKISVLLRKNLKNNQKSAFYENLSKIKEVFRLDDNEFEIITFLFLIKNDEELEDAFKHNSQVDMDNIIKSIRLYCRFFDIKPKKMRDYLSKDSKLIKSGILNKVHNGLMISDYIEAYLAGISPNGYY